MSETTLQQEVEVGECSGKSWGQASRSTLSNQPAFPRKVPTFHRFYSLQKQDHLLETEVETCLRDISDSTVSGS